MAIVKILQRFIIVFILSVITTLLFGCASNRKDASIIFKNSIESIVEIKAYTESKGTSFGSAVIIDSKGTFVTNFHVVSYSILLETVLHDEIYIRFSDDEGYILVDVVNYDENNDLAFLRISDYFVKLNAISIGNSDKIKYGGLIYAIGNGNNYGISIAVGIISSPLLNISYDGIIRKVIQCDLTITNGNSGGALIDSVGKLIGITTFRMRDNKGDIIHGISYSIPINIVMEVYNSEFK